MMLTVNLAAAQLKQPEFVGELEQTLADSGFPASRLVLELTETAMFSDTQTTLARLQALRELGVQIAIDDFGTGYSSLGYLRRFRVDYLKIARDFVGRPDDLTDDWAFAHAIVALGRSLGLHIVAEGIEQQGQLERLREMGCELGQGFLFAAPLEPREMADLLRSQGSVRPSAVRQAAILAKPARVA
jgi:EAL domain-containing protein (putative c-di-GMP-specific phosphodiesterase class I)